MPPLPADLPTPCAILDEGRMDANIARMQSRMDALGVRLRPHVKTAKCVQVARRQREAGAQAITVSTLREAQVFFEAGFTDILYAVCMVPAKLAAVEALIARGCDLAVIVDSVEAAHALAERGRATGIRPRVLIEVDSDGHRSGVDPASELLLAVGRALAGGGAKLAGVMTHAGASYDCRTPETLAAMASRERDCCVLAARRLSAAGLPCPIVSVGSTPTALAYDRLDGVTEVRAGVYVFFDLVMAGIGVCTPDEIALSVLTTVIGHQSARGLAIVDAGWMAMSRDRGTQSQAVDQGYGLVRAEDGTPLEPWILRGANQEHGIVGRRDGSVDPAVAQRFPIGTRLRVLPNHACATGAQHEAYHVIGGDGRTAVWPRFGGWWTGGATALT